MSILTSDIADQLIAEQGFDIIIPGHFTAIEDEAFFERKLKSVGIPDSIALIGNYAFSENQLTGVDLPDGVETVGKDLFLVSGPWGDHAIEDFDFTLDEKYDFDENDLIPVDYNWDYLIAYTPTTEIIDRVLGVAIPRTPVSYTHLTLPTKA